MQAPPHGQRKMPKHGVVMFERPIGQLMLNFALADHALDFWLMETFPVAVKANVGSKMPFDLGHKIVFLNKCFERLPQYASVSSDAARLLGILEAHNRIRNTVAHGALSHFEEEPEATMFFARLRYDKDAGVHLIKDEPVSITALERANGETADAVAEMHKIVELF